MEEKDEKKEEEIEIVKVEEEKEPEKPQPLVDVDRDALLAEELNLLMNEFQTEIVEEVISRLRVYLAISAELNFIVGIDYSNYPEKPLLTVQDHPQKLEARNAHCGYLSGARTKTR
jgi:hypothetical protein